MKTVLRLALNVLTLYLLSAATAPAQDVCQYATVGSGQVVPDGSDTCPGNLPKKTMFFKKTFNMDGQTSCQENNYYTQFTYKSENIFAGGECGNTGPGTPAVCIPIIHDAAYSSFGAWTVSKQQVYFEIDTGSCEYIPEQTTGISIAVEGCTGSICCGSAAQAWCGQIANVWAGWPSCTCTPPVCHEPENCLVGTPCEDYQYLDTACNCCKPEGSPILVDLRGNGIQLSSPDTGIFFDIFGTGSSVRLSWPTSETTFFLALDRNGNGLIDGGHELFGNNTRLRDGARAPHGYVALSELDDNRDGRIDSKDAAFVRLRLWRRPVGEPTGIADEYLRLSDAGITALSLNYSEYRRRDEWGNAFRYRSRVEFGRQQDWSYDVFLKFASSSIPFTPASKK